MATKEGQGAVGKSWRFSLDSWAVMLALLLALLVRAGAFKHVPW